MCILCQNYDLVIYTTSSSQPMVTLAQTISNLPCIHMILFSTQNKTSSKRKHKYHNTLGTVKAFSYSLLQSNVHIASFVILRDIHIASWLLIYIDRERDLEFET